MRTDDLIKALSADARNVEPPITATIADAVAIGTVLSLVLFLWLLGLRPDFSQVIVGSVRFLLKFFVTLSAAVPAFLVLRGLSRPDYVMGRRVWLFALAPAILFFGSLVEIASLSTGEWYERMIGHNSSLCMTMIPLLSLAPMGAVFSRSKRGLLRIPLPPALWVDFFRQQSRPLSTPRAAPTIARFSLRFGIRLALL